jgi:malonyl-CoA O-methyltransferase
MIIDKLRVRESFSRAAKYYDRYALIQHRIADGLTARLKRLKGVSNILDIGTGTARLTIQMSQIFPEADIYGLDFASGMLEEARNNNGNTRLIQADAQNLSLKTETFDLIISNLSYQWIDDLTDAFSQVHSALRREGNFLLSVFGEGTFKELRESLQEALYTRSMRKDFIYLKMPSKEYVYRALSKAGFRCIELNQEIHREFYPDLFSILRWLKLTGGSYRPEGLFDNLGTRQILNEASAIYKCRHRVEDKIYATFEVIYAQAQR